MPAEQLAIGSLIMVKPGDGVPADGIVVSGASRMDESMLTGEPAPVSKRKDDKVTGTHVVTIPSAALESAKMWTCIRALQAMATF